MRVFSERLAPDGLAFVSFNALPGARLRQAVRDMALVADEGVDEPRAKLELARAFLAELIEAWSDTEADESAMKAVAQGHAAQGARGALHDELAPGYAPELLSQVVARARPFGLAYLCDAEPNVSAEGVLSHRSVRRRSARAPAATGPGSSSLPISATCGRSATRSSPAAARRTGGASPPACAASGRAATSRSRSATPTRRTARVRLERRREAQHQQPGASPAS